MSSCPVLRDVSSETKRTGHGEPWPFFIAHLYTRLYALAYERVVKFLKIPLKIALCLVLNSKERIKLEQ